MSRDTGGSHMRRLAAFAVVLVHVLWPIAIRAQEAASAQQLQQLVIEQLRRIEALEAQLAQLKQQVEVISGQQLPTAITEEDRLEEPVEHAYDGYPPMDLDEEAPNADLPQAGVIDSYGSLRVLTATDTDGHSEVRDNSSRLGIRGEKELFGALTAFGRYEMGLNMVANDRAIL